MGIGLAVVSDIHYASAAERARGTYFLDCVEHPVRRLAVKLYRRYVWLRDPFAHNHLLPAFVERAQGADWVVANGDYSCDSAFIGVSDDAACASAQECLQQLRGRFGAKFKGIIGDHELGKKPLGADLGGMRLASYERARGELGLEPFWRLELGNYVVIGLVSTLVALPVVEPEALPEEVARWRELRAEHLAEIRAAFDALRPEQRVILFCHDPTALPFLGREPVIREKLPQVERTIIGHLHTQLVLWKSRWLAGMPVIHSLGHTPKRLSQALHEARDWKPFKVALCPSLAGIELWRSGGYAMLELDPAGRVPARFRCCRLR